MSPTPVPAPRVAEVPAFFRVSNVDIGGRLAAGVLIAVVVCGFVAPLAGYDPVADVSPGRADLGASAAHWLGTDHLGRDVAARLVLATRAFVWPGVGACLLSALIGVPLGACSGYFGGWIEGIVRFLFTVIAAVPRFVLVLLTMSIYGDSMPILALFAGLSFVPLIGEAVHARIEELRANEYVLASRAYGVPTWRIVAVHLVWAGAGPAIARQMAALFGYFLVLETTLSYIGGFGVQEPTPSWGNMLVFGWGRSADNPWAVVAPAIALWVTVAATNRLGQWVGESGRD